MSKRKNLLIIVALVAAIAVFAVVGPIVKNQSTQSKLQGVDMSQSLLTTDPDGVGQPMKTEVVLNAKSSGAEAETAEATETPAAGKENAEDTETATDTDAAANPLGVVVVDYGNTYGLLPVTGEDYTYPLYQETTDGTMMLNVIHVLPNGVYMESSTCDNQDCVNEGEVTFDNKDTRLLMNYVICLPNNVCLELYTWDEFMAASTQQ